MKYVIQVDMYQIHVAFPAKNTVHSDTENKLITNLKKMKCNVIQQSDMLP